MTSIDPRDRRLSMMISPRPKRQEDYEEELRTLLVHRLMDGPKAVLRRSIKDEHAVSVFCEPCGQWQNLPRRSSVPTEWQCQQCERYYRIELAVYEEIHERD